mmetsp:Transcript_8233/g.15391  ORF Transcript_8233/g.15391 Transcript_8233/m.15391 type:complete len:460 (+) Transcript_8233:74-1453(+)
MFQSASSTPYTNRNQRRKRRQFLPVLTSNESGRPKRSSLDAYILGVAKAALKIVAGASITTSVVLALQLVWIVLKTPRLPPPPLSGVDFIREGRVMRDDGNNDNSASDDDSDCDNYDFIGDVYPSEVLNVEVDTSQCNERTSESNQNNITHWKRKEFRLVLVGDSPVEGIGNTHHDHALGGQTARAFAQLVCRQEGYDCVRYWSHGKSGLTARGIEEDMVPLLYRVLEDVRCSPNDNDATGKVGGTTDDEPSSEPAIHAIVVVCGVNNVLDPMSTTSSFHSEVRSLLASIRRRNELKNTPLIVLGLPDFARLPFLPWPLSFALGLRGRRMQRALEVVVKEIQQLDGKLRGKSETILVNIPEVQDVVGSIGYHRHDSTGSNSGDGATGSQSKNGKSEPLKMRLCHPLLKHLGDSSLDQTKLGGLRIEDFLCDDGFHPGGYGTVYVGNLIAEAYGKLMNLP